uniref:TRAPP14 C-terminal domain-containing protein n=1 Tax=Anser cygnoides TaxID=8845 RepID=A0A8B9EIW9_ANSCY
MRRGQTRRGGQMGKFMVSLRPYIPSSTPYSSACPRGEAGGLRGQKGEAEGVPGLPPDPPVPPQLSQHMKLKLQFTASVGSAEARALSRRSSPGSPAVRDLVERHQAGLGRSQSFSHQQPARGHLIRSGSVMERRAITPPVGSPVGRPLPAPPPERAALSLDKIAKRECKVLVVEPVK